MLKILETLNRLNVARGKRFSQSFIFFVVITIIALSCQQKSELPKVWVNAEFFRNPPVEYRSAPFYSLNDLLDTAELARQITGFKEGGYGGCFLHSRGGLLTEYMGKDWWDAMDAAVRTSKQLGLKAWFYDEDKWPSGFAGGKIPLMNEEFHARCLTRFDKSEKNPQDGKVLLEDDKYKYVIHKARMGNSWFNGTAYVDLLNPDMVKAFIDSAYAPYLDRYKGEVGTTVPGIFTDEPQVSARVSGGRDGSVTFSPVVIDAFNEMHGYDILSHLPSLFDTVGNFKKIRYDYYQTISRCFEENFSKQIGEYCASKNAIFTGHYNGEESFASAMTNSGNSMVHYRHMQMPGIDHLGLQYNYLNAGKSVSSVANQYGIARRMCEAYGISGQNMNFEDRKWLLDFLTLNGINFIVPHLALYSMKGERKRDYPPNFGPAQPYWDQNRLFEDYTGRMCYVNTLGQYAADIVLIHPLESEYLGIRNNSFGQYDKCLNMLQNLHRDYDLGDEQILAEIGKVKGHSLEIGKMSYNVVILPAMVVIRQSTVNLLKKFHAAGGKILVYGSYPGYVDGESSPDIVESLKEMSQFAKADDFAQKLNELLTPEFSLNGPDNEQIWTSLRKVNGGGILQLSNTSRLKEAKCELTFSSPVENLALWDPETGRSMKLAFGNDAKVTLHFAATQSWLITFGSASKEASFDVSYQISPDKEPVMRIEGPWKGKRLDPNALTLDFARYSIDDGKSFGAPEPVIGIHQRLTKQQYRGNLILKFEVRVDDIPQQCSLVVEQPHLYEFNINGTPLQFNGTAFYRDHAFKVQDISGMLKQGQNEIALSVNYIAPEPSSLNAIKRYGTEIESIYLTGDFGVSVTPSQQTLNKSQKYQRNVLVEKPVNSLSQFAITKEKETFENDLVKEGYPFYAGSFVLTNSFQIEDFHPENQYFISFPLFEAIVLKVRVNGTEFSPMVYSPYETDITKVVVQGENKVEVVLTNSLRNLLGPYHHTDGELNRVGPSSFTGNPGWPNTGGERDWYEIRLKGVPQLWRDDYCLVPFGLLEPPVISGTR